MSGNTIVIGSGPAGLAAALSLSRLRLHPLILERLDRPALKLSASGGGRCNFSNVLEPEDFMRKFGREGFFMRDALRSASREFLLEFLHSEGIEPVIADGFHYFPASGRARDLADAFLRASGAEVRTRSEVSAIETADGGVSGVTLKTGDFIPAGTVILAAGGCAWEGLGTSAGLKLARLLGHTIRKPLPAVAPLIVQDTWVGTLAGVTLPDARLTLRAGRRTLSTEGSLLFTHTGFSGFPALDLAGEVSSLCDKNGQAELILQICADKEPEFWKQLLDSSRQKAGQRSIRAILNEFMPRSLTEVLTEQCGCAGTKAANLPAESLRRLTEKLSGWKLTLTGAGPMEKAMVMRGGVSLKEVDPETLSSRLIRGLYFAGEILDLAGPCGGYNMQWAFSSGFLAGRSAGEWFLNLIRKGNDHEGINRKNFEAQ
ncbi:MAG: aminoacetone oxidase family FAD-binding enzyme [Lentisphaeria bacterium]|nr:aminoacetone oxidase family FAD-binding enzyme [Lentisphaeria bacterium]